MTLRLLDSMRPTFPASLVLQDRRNFLFSIPVEVTAGTAMEACLDDTVLLGEVLWCRPYHGHFEVLVEMQHSLAERQEWYGVGQPLVAVA